MILAVAGRRVDASDASPQRFPQDNVALVAQRLRTLLRKVGATAVVGSAACGADLLALSEASAARIRGRIVLPVGTRRVQELSLVVRSPEGPAVIRSVPCRFVPLVGEEGYAE